MNRDEIRNYIIQMYETLKKWLFQFIDWRERRIVRFYGLPKWKKTANTILTFFCLFLFYLLIVDINFLWLFGKSPSLRAISNPPQSLSSEIISLITS